MSTNKSNKPELRFKGFSDDWEQRKVGDCFLSLQNNTLSRAELSDENGTVMNVHYGDVLTKFSECLDVSKDRLPFIKKQFFMDKFKTSYLKNGDVIVSDTAEDETVGKCIEIIGMTNQKVLSGLHTIPLRPKEQFATGYLGFYLNSSAYHRQLKPLMQGIKVTSISKSAMLDTVIKYPSDIWEQTLIGQYFMSLDNLVTLHQRKCDDLKIIKKSMLDNLFPKIGEKVPKWRFKGFNNDWEQRKVGELLSERIEQFPKSDEYPLMAFVANEGVAPKGDRYDRSALVNDTEGKLYKRTEFGDFIYSSNNLETGSIGLNKYGNATISPVYSIFRPTGIADSDFIGRRFVRKDFINEMVKWRQGVIYGQWKIHEEDFLKIEVMVPSLEEQRQIGSFLDNLDHLITLHQREVEQLKKAKQFFLEKMFI